MPGNDESIFTLRPYTPADAEAAIALWLDTWQTTYPQFDFAARLPGGASTGARDWPKSPRS